MSRSRLSFSVVALLSFSLCGAPEAMHALAQDPAPQQAQGQQQQQQQQQQQPGVVLDPSQGPLTPVPQQQEQQQNAPGQTLPAHPQPQTEVNGQAQQTTEPLGAAAAGGVATAGGGASRPAGTAIAPAKQHQVRSFLIRLGAVAAAGVAIGTVYALSKGTSSTPPNATATSGAPVKP